MVQVSELLAGEQLVQHGQPDDYHDSADNEQSSDDAVEELEESHWWVVRGLWIKNLGFSLFLGMGGGYV